MIASVSRIVMGGMLVLAAGSKMTEFSWFVKTLAMYELVPKKLAKQIATAVIAIEIMVGAWLLTGFDTRWSGLAALCLFCVFMLVLGGNLARGKRNSNCGCFSFWKKTELGWHLLLRNLGFAGLASLSVFASRLDAKVTGSVFLASALLLLYPFLSPHIRRATS